MLLPALPSCLTLPVYSCTHYLHEPTGPRLHNFYSGNPLHRKTLPGYLQSYRRNRAAAAFEGPSCTLEFPGESPGNRTWASRPSAADYEGQGWFGQGFAFAERIRMRPAYTPKQEGRIPRPGMGSLQPMELGNKQYISQCRTDYCARKSGMAS